MASTRSRKAKQGISEKPYHLTPSEIESLRQDSIKAMDQLMNPVASPEKVERQGSRT